MVQFACNLYSAYWVQFPWCFMGVGREFILLPRDVGMFVDFFSLLYMYSDTTFILTGNAPRLLFSFLYCVSLCRMREDMSSVVCVKETEGQGDPGEKLSQDELLCRTREVMQGLEALRAEHQAILEGLMGTLRCLKQSQEGRAVEEKTAMIQRSMEMLELGLSEAQVKCGNASKVG